MKRTKAGINDSDPLTFTRRNMERLGADFFQQQKPTEVFIPPYSMYVALGELVVRARPTMWGLRPASPRVTVRGAVV
jgi:hypothetical protein